MYLIPTRLGYEGETYQRQYDEDRLQTTMATNYASFVYTDNATMRNRPLGLFPCDLRQQLKLNSSIADSLDLKVSYVTQILYSE